ncbi:MAG: TPR domain-containing protein [Rhodospirillaceae bacterium]|nr:MAG: TPR domain-containing protein [Rhodospirillaceae bacterium]
MMKDLFRLYSDRLWTGESLSGWTILVVGEQGLGDVIQFVRYVPLLVERGARVVLVVHPILKSLLNSSLDASVVVTGLDELPPLFDVFCSLLSLPRVFGTTLHSIPAAVPYLRPPPALVEVWRERLGTAGIKIGLVWRGNPSQTNDHNRSAGATRFLDLVAAFVGQVTFVSLQKDPPAEEWAMMAPFVRDVNADLKTFADTAAIIANLDLVIAVDTSVAHLAGAMGKPLWVLLTFAPSSRYMLERTDNPWY